MIWELDHLFPPSVQTRHFSHHLTSTIPNRRIRVDLPLTEQLSKIKSLADIPSVMLGDVEDGCYVEARSEAVKDETLEEPGRVVRES